MAGEKHKTKYVDPFKDIGLEHDENTQHLLNDRKLVVTKGTTAAYSNTWKSD